MYATLILVLVLIFSSASPGLAVPIESIPEPGIQGGESVAAATAPSPPPAKIPDSPVTMFVREGTDSRWEIFFIDVRYGYDLVDFESYKAWCLHKDEPMSKNTMHKVRLYNCYDPNLPPKFRGTQWNQINYIMNHKKGSKKDIQQAIWHFTDGKQPATLSAQATQLIEEANLKGKDYKPGEGELIAIVIAPDKAKQAMFIESKIPEAVPFEVQQALFIPPMIPAAAMASPSLLPLIALAPLPFIPLIPGGSPPGPGPGPPVPEPSSLLLLASGMACILISRTIRRHIKISCR